MTPDQEVADPVVDVIVDRPVGREARAVAEVRGPTADQAVQAIAHLGPRSRVAGSQEVADLGREPAHALLRRARPEVPVAILAVAVRAERVAEEVEALAPSIASRGLRLVEGEPEPGHHLPRPRQSLGRVTAAEDDEVVGIGDDAGPKGDAPSARTPMLQEAVHVEVGQQRADHSTHNLAKLPFDPSVTIRREQLRPKYRDGFWGAPLAPCRPFGAGQPAGGGADGPEGAAPRGAGEP